MNHTTNNDAMVEKPGYKFVVLGLVFLHYTLNYMDRQIIAILSVPIQNELHLSDMQLGLLGGFAFALFYSTFAIPIALLADRSSRKRIMAVAIAVWSGFTALCGVATNFWQLFVFRLGVGIGEAGGVAPSYSLLSDYFPPNQRGRALAVISSGIPIGSALGLVLGGVVAEYYGWRMAFISVGLFGVLVAPMIWLVIREPVRGRYDNIGKPEAPQKIMDTFRCVAACPSFWLLSLGMGTGAMVLYGFGFWLPAFFQRSHDLSLQDTALLFGALVLIGGLLGNFLGGWFGDKLGSHKPQYYAYVPSIAFVVGLPLLIGALWVDNLPLAFFLFIFPQACGVIASSPVGVAVQNLGSPATRTTFIACYLFVVNLLGLGLGAVVLGALSDLLAERFVEDSLRYSLLVCAALLYPLAAIFYALAGRRLPRDWYGGKPDSLADGKK